jgi:SNF2 family DNA or RNA helicase
LAGLSGFRELTNGSTFFASASQKQWPKIEHVLHGKFKLDLLLHQQHAICWMIQMENLKGAYGINSLLWEQRTFPDGGHFYYSPALGQVRLGAPPPLMKGGLVCDEQGLGKTVEILGLILATLPELKQEVRHRIERNQQGKFKFEGDSYYSAASDDEEEHVSHTTLIIVPPALLGQWLHEIEKATSSLTVSLMVSQTGELKRCLPAPSVGKDGKGKSVDAEGDDWEIVKSSDILLTTYDALERPRACKKLADVEWGRIVLDEMQEIRRYLFAKPCDRSRRQYQSPALTTHRPLCVPCLSLFE